MRPMVSPVGVFILCFVLPPVRWLRSMRYCFRPSRTGCSATTLPRSRIRIRSGSCWTSTTLRVRSGTGELMIPTPPTLAPPPGDGWSIFTDLDGVHFWETWAVERPPDGTFHLRYLCHVNLKGTGWGDPVTMAGVGIRAAGASLLGGLIHPTELAGVPLIEHAVPIELDVTQLK